MFLISALMEAGDKCLQLVHQQAVIVFVRAKTEVYDYLSFIQAHFFAPSQLKKAPHIPQRFLLFAKLSNARYIFIRQYFGSTE